MKIIVLNCGSSSIKYQLFDLPSKEVLAKGLVDKIGLKGSLIKHARNDGSEVKLEGEILDHQIGIEYLLGILISEKYGSIKSLDEIQAVGHRVVHAGEKFNGSVYITPEVVAALEECIDLAPLHNPPNLKGIYSITKLLPEIPQVGVFDTAFHQTMPDYVYLYGIPYSLYEKYKIRRYGFHGSSHRYVSQRAAEMLGKKLDELKIITCHLGNGASIAAIKNGKSLDTSMGMTPIEGLMMGTRTGDLDIGAFIQIMNKEEIDINTANTLVNKHSGMLGVSGVSSDMRDVEHAAADGNERAKVTLEMYYYRIRKYIGAYAAAMGGVDVIVFTGGVGENDSITRYLTTKDMEFMGIQFDQAKNEGLRGKEAILSKDDSRVKVMVIPTNEELVIALDTFEIVNSLK
ncbi:acetate kinase [Lentimicrobium sp.]|jgi:acetate kinase|uniref:acetate/propionate family kinase n=1 Tax=Lentimicrobium sp. TaxID=2034841 RepID=UPI0025CF884B|nr:acetate kinase [Lentimicrobium sp.]MCO5256933.1 acetate kinase [Lentimicrobium sp.]MCO5261898.1 acetate kinase [Lentimicrobium sp.]HOP12655.1 acetate kinase [Lentimicrobium sp.]HPF64275.1 acetate kinase [Lentimicrobium sp.]HPJ61926.1 acetate kinase [Lentimicrobium sp.]